MSFKKSTSLILIFFLLVSNMGMALNVHFCEGKLASISSAYKVEETCKMPKSSGKKCCAEKDADHKKCCSDKELDLKKKTEEVVVKTFSFQIDMPSLVEDWKPLVFEALPQSIKQTPIEYCCDANAPPLFKLYSQYIFYA